VYTDTALSQNSKTDNSTIKKDINLVFSEYSFHNTKTEDALATAQVLANHIKKLKKIKNNFNVKLANNDKDLIGNHSADFDLMLITTEQYLRLKQILPLEPYCINYTDGTYGYIYHLIVNKNDNINDISQLKGETIYIQAHSEKQASSFWLNKLLKDANQQSKEKYFGKISIDSKATNVLLPVFFKKAKACIVTNSSLNLIQELNPGIKNQIKILHTSAPIVLGITCLNSNKTGTEEYNILKEVLPSLHENEYGRQLLDMFNAEKLILFKEEYLNGYFNLTK
jgi:phosphonate transport system substrate-binding protein